MSRTVGKIGPVVVTVIAGPQRDDGGDRRQIQLNVWPWKNFALLTTEQARCLADVLDFLSSRRDRELIQSSFKDQHPQWEPEPWPGET